MPHGDESYANSIYDDMGHFAEQQRQSELEKLRAENAALRAQVERQKAALEKIELWFGEFPATGKFWDDDPERPMSYAAAFGSNGERDYMRAVARLALTSDHSTT